LKKRNAAYKSAAVIAPPIASPFPAELKSDVHIEETLSTTLQKLKVSDKASLPTLKTWYLEFYPSAIQDKKKDKKRTSTETSTVGVDAEWKEEAYEKMCIPGVTKFFKTFQKAVQEEPEQCIRYLRPS
jgi:hypothetical protein